MPPDFPSKGRNPQNPRGGPKKPERAAKRTDQKPYREKRKTPGPENHRGEIFSRRLKGSAGSSYFLNLKENREADIYLNIVESRLRVPQQNYPPRNGEVRPKQEQRQNYSFERHSILVFAEQRDTFLSECLAALEALATGRDYAAQIQSSQREFVLQVCSRKRQSKVLTICEQRIHYTRPLQEKIQIPQGSATAFSQLLIQTAEKWLQFQNAQRQKNTKL